MDWVKDLREATRAGVRVRKGARELMGGLMANQGYSHLEDGSPYESGSEPKKVASQTLLVGFPTTSKSNVRVGHPTLLLAASSSLFLHKTPIIMV